MRDTPTDTRSTELSIERAEITSPPARQLIGLLDAELSAQYPEPGATHFRLDTDEVAPDRGAFLIAKLGGRPVGCGAVRRVDASRRGSPAGELKRMYVAPDVRGRGVGRALVLALEAEARRIGLGRLVLETGVRQEAALRLYEGMGFERIAPYGEYIGSPVSVCFAKTLDPVVRQSGGPA